MLLNFVLHCPCRRLDACEAMYFLSLSPTIFFFFIKYRIKLMSFPVTSFLSYPASLVNSNKDSGYKIVFYHFREMLSSSISDLTCALKKGGRSQSFRRYS